MKLMNYKLKRICWTKLITLITGVLKLSAFASTGSMPRTQKALQRWMAALILYVKFRPRYASISRFTFFYKAHEGFGNLWLETAKKGNILSFFYTYAVWESVSVDAAAAPSHLRECEMNQAYRNMLRPTPSLGRLANW